MTKCVAEGLNSFLKVFLSAKVCLETIAHKTQDRVRSLWEYESIRRHIKYEMSYLFKKFIGLKRHKKFESHKSRKPSQRGRGDVNALMIIYVNDINLEDVSSVP